MPILRRSSRTDSRSGEPLSELAPRTHAPTFSRQKTHRRAGKDIDNTPKDYSLFFKLKKIKRFCKKK